MAAMMMRAKAPLALRATTTVSSRRAVSLVARAAEQEPAAPAAAPATPVAEEPLNGVSVQQMQPIPVAAAPSGTVAAPSFFEAMSFSNPTGPETINGRLAMLAVFAAIGAELSTGESVLTQFEGATPVVLATWLLFSVASLVPLFKGADPKASFGPFTPQAERINGWAAMIGIAGLLIVEGVNNGQALF